MGKFGIEEKENIAEVLFDLTMAEGAKYIKETYKLDKTIQEIIDGINSVVYEFYEKEVRTDRSFSAFADPLPVRI